MKISEIINEHLNITEAFELSPKLTVLLQNKENRELLFEKIVNSGADLTKDIISEYFQDFQGDRKRLKQDFTPPSLCDLVARLSSPSSTIADICAGTGGLSISQFNYQNNSEYYFEEISKNTLPFLLFNLALRNINGTVVHGNSLTQESEAIYQLTSSDKYSQIELTDKTIQKNYNLVVSNPPYSLAWEPFLDGRWNSYGLAPKSKADYAFLLHGLSLLNDTGEMYAILPHGVLFRGQAEGVIRKSLLEFNLIDTIIGLPEKLFMNTSIPVVIMKLKKNRENTDILFVDASKEFLEQGKNNVLTDDHIDKIATTAKHRMIVERYSNIATLEKIKENEYNLNIPRYVDTFEKEEIPNPIDVMTDLINVNEEIKVKEKELYSMMQELVGTNSKTQEELDKLTELFGRYING